MSIYQRQPYTYFIKWASTGMQYYGVRYASKCHPDDFWVKYFTSSKYVKEYRKIHGEPDVVQIRRVFSGCDSVTLAKNWESRVLSKMRVIHRDDYLNKRDGNGLWSTDIIEKHRAATKKAMNEPLVKKKHMDAINSPEIKKKHLLATTKAQQTPEARKNNSEAQKIAWKSEEVKESHRKAIDSEKYKKFISGRKGKNAPYYDPAIRIFEHATGITEICTRHDLLTKYNLNSGHMSELLKGRRKTTKGWRFIGLA